MSIYPKKIKQGDNVIFHLRLDNHSDLCMPVILNFKISNKKGEYSRVLLVDKKEILPPHDKVERYLMITAKRNMPLGKYYCNFTIKYLNKKAKSLTIDNDFFVIEKVSLGNKGNFIKIKNHSNKITEIKIFYLDNKVSKKLKPFEEISISNEKFLYVLYANKDILK